MLQDHGSRRPMVSASIQRKLTIVNSFFGMRPGGSAVQPDWALPRRRTPVLGGFARRAEATSHAIALPGPPVGLHRVDCFFPGGSACFWPSRSGVSSDQLQRAPDGRGPRGGWESVPGAGGSREPDAPGSGGAERDFSGWRGEGQGLIVVALEEAQLRSGTDTALLEEFEEAAVALVDSAHRVAIADFGVGEQN